MVMTHRLLVAAASVVILVAAVATASAQSASKGYVQALGGATFGTETSWMMGGGGSEREILRAAMATGWCYANFSAILTRDAGSAGDTDHHACRGYR
jgi:hypothetical protein